MPLTQSPLHPRGERGFSMFIVVTAMLVTAMFVAAAFAAADGGMNLSVENKQRKASYAAAEAGLGYYLKRLRENPDVWTQCDTASAPNSSEASPINQQWDGQGTDPRRWRKIPGVPAEYTVELLHTSKYTKCETSAQQAGLDDRHVHGHVQGPHHRPGHDGQDRQAQRDRDLPPRELPEVRVLHRPGEPRPAGRDHVVRAQQPADQLRQPLPHGAYEQGLRRDPVRLQRRDQRSTAHQRREPAGLRHADLRPREEQGRLGRPRPTRSRSGASRPATSSAAGARPRRRRSGRRRASSRSTPRR